MRLKKVSAILCVSVLASLFTCNAHASNNYIPELQVYEQNKHPKIEIGIDMPDEDVIGTYDFESGCSLDRRGVGHVGNQSLSSEAKYSGSKGYMLTDTVTLMTGNDYHGAALEENRKSDSSAFQINKNIFANSGAWISISFKAKSFTKDSRVSMGVQARKRVQYTASLKDINGNKVLYAETLNFKNGRPSTIKLKLSDGSYPNLGHGAMISIASKYSEGDSNWDKTWYAWDSSVNKLVNRGSTSSITASKCEQFNSGDEVQVEQWINTGGTRVVKGDSQWRNISYNFKSASSNLYDTLNDGYIIYGSAKTSTKMYIDDLKFGKASKVQVMRDNSTIVYNDYGSEFTDTSIISKPSSPSVTEASTGSTNVTFKFNAPNTSETHKYKARSLGSSGSNPSVWSQNYSITLGSTIQGYSVKVDKNSNTDPGTTKNNTNGQISSSGYRRGDVIYCHVRSVDQNGNWSAPIHYRYTVGQTATDLKSDIDSFVSKLSTDNNIGNNVSKEDILRLRTNTNILYTVNDIQITKATKYNKGNLKVKAQVNGENKESNKVIECKDEYQTKDEYKSDITNYIDNGNIQTDISYEKPDKIKETIKEQLIKDCKDNPSLNDIEVAIKGGGTEFSEGSAEAEVYYKK